MSMHEPAEQADVGVYVTGDMPLKLSGRRGGGWRTAPTRSYPLIKRERGTGVPVLATKRGERAVLSAVAVSCLLCVTACAQPTDSDVDIAQATATAFYAALARGDGAAACQALAPQTRAEVEKSAKSSCDTAISAAGLPAAGTIRSADTFGQGARVVLANDVVFLSRFGSDWKITAAGCKPQPGKPYDCDLEGG